MLAMKDLMISSTEGTPGSDRSSTAADSAPYDNRSILVGEFPHSMLVEFRLTRHGEIPFLETGVILHAILF